MVDRTARELRLSAERFRVMATEGDDVRLQDALLLVADEFEQEAKRVEATEHRPGVPA
jgi:CRP-like cAMP-binding protein